jgi:ABC-type phosphate transport system auxiliary subunit
MLDYRKNLVILITLGLGTVSTGCFAGSDAEKLIQQEHNQTGVLLQKMQEAQAKQMKALNDKIQLQLKQVKEDLDKAIKTVNDQSQAQLKKVNTDLMTQIKQVQAECAKACNASTNPNPNPNPKPNA